jgi:hypothetical protein
MVWLRTGRWKKHKIVYLTKGLVDEFEQGEFARLGINNAVCLEEIHELYPFVELPWNGSEEDAKVLAALLLRFTATFPVKMEESSHISCAVKHGMVISSQVFVPPLLTLITQYYVPDKPKRAREINECLRRNIENPLIDKIFLLNESPQPYPKSDKIVECVIGSRLTYADIMKFIKLELPPNLIVMFANSDIYYDDTLRYLWSVDLRDTFISLLRYDVKEDGTSQLFGPRADSQDTWIMMSDCVKSREWSWTDLDFPFGKAGCDNAINVEMLKKKMVVVNPALTIRSHHLHRSGVRNYDPSDIVDKPIYLHIHPTGLQDMQPIIDIDRGMVTRFLEPESFSRNVRGLATEAERITFCKMLARDTPYKWSAQTRNVFPEVEKRIQILQFEDCFQTNRGLPFGYNKLWLGKSKLIPEAWATTETSTLTPSLATRFAHVAYISKEATTDPMLYMLTYLAKIFWLRTESSRDDGVFWSPNTSEFLDVLKMFSWPQKTVPVIEWKPDTQIFSQKALMWYPQNEYLITREEVFMLREFMLDGWLQTATTDIRKLVCFIDGTYITDKWVTDLEKDVGENITVESIWPGTAPSACVAALRGAMGAVVVGGKGTQGRWGWFWTLPRDAIIFEIQTDMNPSGDLLHMTAAGGGRHSLVVIPKSVAAMEGVRPKIAASFCEITRACTVEIQAPTAPIIYVPDHAQGFFHHAGDSFREMVDLWAEKGYVTKVMDESVYNVWLKGVGEVLLYDRPTYDWFQKSPDREQKWKRALFGNPPPLGVNAYAWSFWPRRPRLVEELVAAGAPRTEFADRKKRLVFYGKIENAVQNEHRRKEGVDWSFACDEFQMVMGDKAAYKYTQKEYLEALANSHFGLCLAGYGKKCHREVECMAMGCVPVITPDVDIRHYANPPEEGIHFVRVSTPEEAYEKTLKIPANEWLVMSLACREWWRRNASCDGMWELTKELADIL